MKTQFLSALSLAAGVAVTTLGVTPTASAVPLFSDSFTSYSYGDNPSGVAMAANGWSQNAAGSGDVTNYGGDGKNFRLLSYGSRAAVSIPDVTAVTVDFDLVGASAAANSPFSQGIIVTLTDTDTAQAAYFSFASQWYFQGSNAPYAGGFAFYDGDYYSNPDGYHMANVPANAYSEYAFRSASLTYDTVNNVVSMSYGGNVVLTETLNTNFIVDEVSFESRFNSDGGVTSAGAAWAIDNLQISGTPIPEPASLALLAAGGLMMLSRRRASH